MVKTARQKLGEVLTFNFSKQRKNDRDVADRCGVSSRDVERWRTGELVPDLAQWKRACQLVAKGLFGSSQLYNEALKEQDVEREQAVRTLQRNGHATTVNGAAVTNFGDKLVAAVVSRAEQAPAEAEVSHASPVNGSGAKRPYATLPPGTRDVRAVNERREYARSIMMQRPKIPARGPDGLIELVRKRFGAGMADIEVRRIREELEREAVERDVRSRLSQERAPDPATKPVPPPVEVATAAVNDADVSAGIELIIGAIPGLQEMTISVDDSGVASVRYDVRKVQVTTVSSQLTVRR